MEKEWVRETVLHPAEMKHVGCWFIHKLEKYIKN